MFYFLFILKYLHFYCSVFRKLKMIVMIVGRLLKSVSQLRLVGVTV